MKFPLSHLWGRARIRICRCLQSFKKETRASRNARIPGILCAAWMRTSKMRKTPGKKKKSWALEQCLKQHSTQDEHWRFLWNSCQDKKASSSLHIKEQWKLSRGEGRVWKMPSFHYNLWEQEAVQSGLARPPSYLTEVTRASLGGRQHLQMKKRTCVNCVHWHRCLKNRWLSWF